MSRGDVSLQDVRADAVHPRARRIEDAAFLEARAVREQEHLK
jgi:hypothetical protein